MPADAAATGDRRAPRTAPATAHEHPDAAQPAGWRAAVRRGAARRPDAQSGPPRQSDEIVIPVNLDCYSLDGLEELVDQVNNVRQLNRKAHIAGVLITDYEKSDTSEAAETWLREKSGLPVFNTIIRHSKKVKDSTFYHKTPIAYCVRSGAAQGYKNFILEYMNKPHMAAEQTERG